MNVTTLKDMAIRFGFYVLAGAVIWKGVGERFFTYIEPYGWNKAIYVGVGYACVLILLDEIHRIQRNV